MGLFGSRPPNVAVERLRTWTTGKYQSVEPPKAETAAPWQADTGLDKL
jgi:hypothetical protein